MFAAPAIFQTTFLEWVDNRHCSRSFKAGNPCLLDDAPSDGKGNVHVQDDVASTFAKKLLGT
jgi:hypothetical protein